MTDIARLGFDIDSDPAKTAAKALLDLGRAAGQMAGSVDKAQTSFRGANGQFKSTAQYAKDNADQIKKLAQEFNPLLAVQLDFADRQKRLSAAIAAGVVPANQAQAAMESLQREMASTAARATASATAMDHLSVANSQGARHASNVFAQLNDIGVMMASGQNPFIMALQQGTQLNQVWANMGAQGNSLRGVVGMLGAGMAQFLNPVGLATIAVIAGGAALVNWATDALGAGDSAKTLEENLSDISGAFSEASNHADLAVEDYSKLIERFGKYASDVRAHSLFMAQVNLTDAFDGFSEKVEPIKGSLADVQSAYTNLKDAQSQLSSAEGLPFADPTSLSIYQEAVRVYAAELDNATAKTGLTKDQSLALARAIDDVGKANGVADLAAKSSIVNDLMREIVGNGYNIPPQLIEAAKAASDLQVEAASTANKMDAAETAAGGVRSATSGAANEASRLATNIAQAASALSGLQSAIGSLGISNIGKRAQLGALQAGSSAIDAEIAGKLATARAEAADAFGSSDAIVRAQAKQNMAAYEAALREDAATSAGIGSALEGLSNTSGGGGGGGGSSGGGGGGGSDQYKSNLDSLIQSLQAETEVVDAWYESSLQTLTDRRASEILSTEEHNALKLALEEEYQKRKAEAQANADNYGLKKTSDYFGALYSLSGSKYDGLLKAQKTFAAANALINTYLAQSQTLADPSLPWYAKIGAMLKIGAAGMGVVNAIKSGGSSGSSIGGSGGSSSAISSASTATATAPEKVVRVELFGDEWAKGLIEPIIKQLQEASKDGRVIIAS